MRPHGRLVSQLHVICHTALESSVLYTWSEILSIAKEGCSSVFLCSSDDEYLRPGLGNHKLGHYKHPTIGFFHTKLNS